MKNHMGLRDLKACQECVKDRYKDLKAPIPGI